MKVEPTSPWPTAASSGETARQAGAPGAPAEDVDTTGDEKEGAISADDKLMYEHDAEQKLESVQYRPMTKAATGGPPTPSSASFANAMPHTQRGRSNSPKKSNRSRKTKISDPNNPNMVPMGVRARPTAEPQERPLTPPTSATYIKNEVDTAQPSLQMPGGQSPRKRKRKHEAEDTENKPPPPDLKPSPATHRPALFSESIQQAAPGDNSQSGPPKKKRAKAKAKQAKNKNKRRQGTQTDKYRPNNEPRRPSPLRAPARDYDAPPDYHQARRRSPSYAPPPHYYDRRSPPPPRYLEHQERGEAGFQIRGRGTRPRSRIPGYCYGDFEEGERYADEQRQWREREWEGVRFGRLDARGDVDERRRGADTYRPGDY